MSEGRTALLLHPVRLRILQAALGRRMTTAALAVALPDVPPASLYRHIAVLVDGGVLEVVAERAVRGATERTLQVALPAAALGPEDIGHLTAEEHLDGATAFLGGVLQAVADYLSAVGVDPARDGFGYRQVAVWADDDELAELVQDLRARVAAAAQQTPGPGRRRRVLTTVLVPDPPPPAA
jgi:DNA-binding transcriptional ArsR family regulator